jgi:hypothetical protein
MWTFEELKICDDKILYIDKSILGNAALQN